MKKLTSYSILRRVVFFLRHGKEIKSSNDRVSELIFYQLMRKFDKTINFNKIVFPVRSAGNSSDWFHEE